MPAASKVMKAPKGWAQLYNKVVEIRRNVTAPVDVIGCDKLAEPKMRHTEAYRFQTLVALMLSAQTRDFCTAEAVCSLQQAPGGLNVNSIDAMAESDVNQHIRMVGMHNNKAKYLKAAARKILDEHKGEVPRELGGLLHLPGVGPKMAHLFLQCADGHNTSGIGVDVHVHRIAQRWKWVPATVKTPEDTRKALEQWLPQKHWSEINEILVGFGQAVCTPLRPKCHLCPASAVCPNAFKESGSSLPKKKPSSSDLAGRSSSSTSSVGRVPAPAGASAEALLDLCGGSSQELLERGWLNAAVPPPQVPDLVKQRMADVAELERDATLDVDAPLPKGKRSKAHRAEGQAVVDAAAPLGHGGSWQLADIEDGGGVVPAAVAKKQPAAEKARAASLSKKKAAAAPPPPAAAPAASKKKQPAVTSKYFTSSSAAASKKKATAGKKK